MEMVERWNTLRTRKKKEAERQRGLTVACGGRELFSVTIELQSLGRRRDLLPLSSGSRGAP